MDYTMLYYNVIEFDKIGCRQKTVRLLFCHPPGGSEQKSSSASFPCSCRRLDVGAADHFLRARIFLEGPYPAWGSRMGPPSAYCWYNKIQRIR